MKMKQNKILIPVVVLLLSIVNGCTKGTQDTQDWPRYLGPNRNSTSDQKGILRTWPENGPEVLWTADIGIGFGGPAVKDGKIFLLDREDKVGDNMRCFDLSSGKELWHYGYEAPGTVMFPGSRSVPTVDGNFVYSCGHNGDLYCININTHKPVWNKNIWTDFGGNELPIWAITQCPLIYGDLLIIASQAPDAGVVAYDKLTGDVKWKTPSLGYVGYVSPAIVKVDGKDHVVMVTPSTNPFRRSSPDEYNPGKIVGIEPDPSGFKPLASAELLKEGGISGDDALASRVGGSTQNWGPLALADGKLPLRDQSRLMCVKVAQ